MIGLDIGTYSLKAVELQKKGSPRGEAGDALTLINFKIQERPQTEPLAAVLKRFLDEARFVSKALTIAISGPLTLARVVELPQMSKEELAHAVRFEAEKFIPFRVEEAVLDYQVISKSADAKRETVLLVASKREHVKNYVDMILEAGFIVNAVDVDGLALTNAFLFTRKEDADERAFVLLNAGDVLLNVSVINNGIPAVLRDITGGGKEISDVIAKGLGVDKREAYQLMRNPPLERQDELFELVRPVINRLAKEIRLSIGYFENQFSKGVETTYLSGGLARLFKLKEFLADSLDLKVESWDPFSSISIGEGVGESLEDVKSRLAVSVGLAIRDD